MSSWYLAPIAAALAAMILAACRCEPADPARRAPAAAPTAPDRSLPSPPVPPDETALLTGIAADPDHAPTGESDRALAAELYVAFASAPETLLERTRAVPEERRRRIAGFLICAAPKLLVAGQDDPVPGAPVQVELPDAVDALIRFSGPRDRARRIYLRQLAGELLVIGRTIESVGGGDQSIAERAVKSQEANLERLELAIGEAELAEWRARLEQIMPLVFAAIVPEC